MATSNRVTRSEKVFYWTVDNKGSWENISNRIVVCNASSTHNKEQHDGFNSSLELIVKEGMP